MPASLTSDPFQVVQAPFRSCVCIRFEVGSDREEGISFLQIVGVDLDSIVSSNNKQSVLRGLWQSFEGDIPSEVEMLIRSR
jgi:hypothetical protein